MNPFAQIPFRISPLLCGGLALLIAGCTAPPSKPTAMQATPSQQAAPTYILELAQDAVAKGNYIIAVQHYLHFAEQSASPEREDALLAAADILVRSQNIPKTQTVLTEIDPRQLTQEQQLKYRMVLARVALLENDNESALEQLRYEAPQHLPWQLLAKWHDLKAELFAAAGNHIGAVRERVKLENMLGDDIDRPHNHQMIWESLSQLTAPALVTLRDQPPPDIFSGWVELAYFAKISEQQPKTLEAQIQQWQQRYPDHPAQGEFVEALVSTQKMLFYRPDNIALLLPLTGNFSAPANAVRDGFFAAYYARPDKSYTPNIKVYDTTDDVETGLEIYQKAVADGIEFIVGPLHKPLLEALAQQEEIPVTTLALNYLSSEDAYIENLYQYGLLPEDEARQVAERAWLDGHNNALALVPEGEWGDRMLATFEKHWQMLDGKVLETQRYDPAKHDFKGPVIDLLNIDQSKQRFRDLKQLLGLEMESEARRRQDVDFIFVAAFPQQARQIRPQLKFYYASEVPVYSTSHAYSGEENTTLDRDMNDIAFCDMPWVFSGNKGSQPQWQEIANLWKANAAPFKRLYAMGIDAYSLIGLLPRFKNGYDYVPAQTGNLYLDGTNRFHRQLVWAYFRNGKPRLYEPLPEPTNDPS